MFKGNRLRRLSQAVPNIKDDMVMKDSVVYTIFTIKSRSCYRMQIENLINLQPISEITRRSIPSRKTYLAY